MRTTVTIDPDLALKLKQVAHERGVPFNTALNQALRAGLAGAAAQSVPYAMPSRPMGVRPGVDLDKALRLAGEIEDTEILRKIDVRN
ncbi:MAG: antitoxin [Acidimicrobiales bacterium]